MLNFWKKEPPPLPQLPGQTKVFSWRAQDIIYSSLGQGTPLLLLHGINGAAWAFEMRQNIEPLAETFKVYAPDLPGFGRSDRRPLRYTAEDYISFITDFAHYIKGHDGKAPAVIASSLAAAYVIAVAAANPELLGALILICPTGLERLEGQPSETAQRVSNILQGKTGDAAFGLLTSYPATRLFLGRDAYFDKQFLTKEVLDGYYSSARQANAKFAPFSFLTGFLNHSVKTEWPQLKNPTLLVWGHDATITPATDAAKFLELRPEIELEVFTKARIAVQDERANDFNRRAVSWLQNQAEKTSTQQQSVAETAETDDNTEGMWRLIPADNGASLNNY